LFNKRIVFQYGYNAGFSSLKTILFNKHITWSSCIIRFKMHLKIISNTDNGDDICYMHLRPCVMIEWNTNVEDTIYNLFVGLGRVATLFPYQHNYKCSRNRLINRILLKVHQDFRFSKKIFCACVTRPDHRGSPFRQNVWRKNNSICTFIMQ